MSKLLLLVLGGYRRWISPLLPPRCRFYPTCSSYFIQALENHGFVKGTTMGVIRLLKCHPWHPGGYDPCPECSGEDNPESAGHKAG